MTNDSRSQDEALLGLLDQNKAPLAVSVKPEPAPSITQRVEAIRAERRDSSNGSCNPPFSSWSD
jgi:hypothetical protein